MTDKPVLHIYVEPVLKEQLKAFAVEEKRSLSSFCAYVLEAYVRENIESASLPFK